MKIVFTILLTFLASNSSFAGIVKEIKGSVDLLVGEKWKPAAVGMEIKDNTKIMTGMDALITIEVKGGLFTVKELSLVKFS